MSWLVRLVRGAVLHSDSFVTISYVAPQHGNRMVTRLLMTLVQPTLCIQRDSRIFLPWANERAIVLAIIDLRQGDSPVTTTCRAYSGGLWQL